MDFLPAGHPLAQALALRNYTDLTGVQQAVLVPEAKGRDLLVSAQTGSGKTVAFGLSMADDLLGDGDMLGEAGLPLALVVAPTRELALQVQRELSWLYQQAGGQVVACVGGMDPRAEQRRLARGAHIVVGTPGRLRDHLERGALRPHALRVVVLDEADEMLDLGFREDLEFILEAAPQQRRTLLFSATLPKPIIAMAKHYQKDTHRIAVAGGDQGHADIEYRAIRVAPNEIEHAVVNLLRFFDSPGSLVFCNTRDSVRHLHATLQERGFAAVALSGELSQNERNLALQALRDGRARVCVATDVAARGIDLPNINLVIHAELPTNGATLQHRSGRTGRAGRKGVSALLVPLSRRRKAEMLLDSADAQALWSGAPTLEEIHRLDRDRLMDSPLLQGETDDEDMEMARALLGRLSAEEVAAALVRLYRANLPAAEDVFDPGPGRPDRAKGEPRPVRERGERGEREWADRERGEPPARLDSSDCVWFRLNLGRQKDADPRWLIPLICRQGKITKQEIGAIRIFERDTRFEIAKSAAERFSAAIAQMERRDLRIDPLGDAPPPVEAAPRRKGPPPAAGGPGPKKVWTKDKPHGAGPHKGGFAGKGGAFGAKGKAKPPRD